MKKILAGLALIAAAYAFSGYNVEIKVTENSAAADCNPNNPTCGN